MFFSSVESYHKMQAAWGQNAFLWYHDFQSDNEWQTIKLYYFYVIKSAYKQHMKSKVYLNLSGFNSAIYFCLIFWHKKS